MGAVGNAFQLAPWAEFIAATDSAWWRKHPEAKALSGRKYAMHAVPGVEHVRIPTMGVCNSGVIALQCSKLLGASKILLLGFDMHGSHFFGPYTNGLSNTTVQKRKVHLQQYAQWARLNPKIEVVNLTQGSALKCFPMARMDEYCRHMALV